MSIHAEHITFTYPGAPAPALDNISVKLEPGKVYGLLGANGSGKSTFLKVLSGFLKPGSGNVTIDGRAITGLSAEQRAQHLSFHPQDPDAPGFLTVYEIVEMACYYGKTSLEDVEHAIDVMNLNALRFSSMGSISGGERQRAFLARALAQNAPVTLWDEPMLNLDPAHQMLFGKLLRNMSSSGCCVLASFHDLTLAANLCDELICFRAGLIPLVGSVSEIMTPANLYETFGVHFATQHNDQGWFSRVLNPDG